LTLTSGATPVVFLMFLASTAPASTSVIGLVSSQDSVSINDSRVSGSATLLEGASVQTRTYSRIKLNNGTRLDLAAGSKVHVFQNHESLESGMTEIQSSSGFEVDARTLKIQPSGSSSIARVRLDGDKAVLVTALNAPVNVMSREGFVVARVLPGAPMSFLPQAAAANAFDNTGCVLNKSGAAIFVDETGNQVFELRGIDMTKAIGHKTHVTGTIDASASPAAGATKVIKVSAAKAGGKDGCSALATKVAATTTAAGLGAAAGVGAGAAAGAAAAGAAAATAGVSTGIVVAGVAAAAAAAGIGTAVAVNSGSSTSP
jgi:hypothetical protein